MHLQQFIGNMNKCCYGVGTGIVIKHTGKKPAFNFKQRVGHECVVSNSYTKKEKLVNSKCKF